MIILYVNKTFECGLSVYKKGTYLIMANYREKWFVGKYPVIFITYFQMFWGARKCVVNLSEKEILKWYMEGCFNLSNLYKFIKQLEGKK